MSANTTQIHPFSSGAVELQRLASNLSALQNKVRDGEQNTVLAVLNCCNDTKETIVAKFTETILKLQQQLTDSEIRHRESDLLRQKEVTALNERIASLERIVNGQNQKSEELALKVNDRVPFSTMNAQKEAIQATVNVLDARISAVDKTQKEGMSNIQATMNQQLATESASLNAAKNELKSQLDLLQSRYDTDMANICRRFDALNAILNKILKAKFVVDARASNANVYPVWKSIEERINENTH